MSEHKIRESLRDAWADWETKTGIQNVADKTILDDYSGIKKVMAHAKIRDEFLETLEIMLQELELIIESLPHEESCPVYLYWKHNWEGEVACNCSKRKLKKVQA